MSTGLQDNQATYATVRDAKSVDESPPPRRGVVERFRDSLSGSADEEEAIETIVSDIQDAMSGVNANGTQKEVSDEYIKILSLLIHRRKGEFENPTQIKLFRLAVEALKSKNTHFAQALINQLKEYKPKKSKLDPRAAIMFGFIGTSLLLLLFFDTLLPQGLPQVKGLVIEQSTFYPLLLMITMAFVGSIVSMLLRIEEFTVMRNKDALTLLAVTFFRPWIAIAMALFIFAVLKTEVISLGDLSFSDDNPNEEAYFLLAVIGFMSGFSERFARGLLEQAEERVTPSKQVDTPEQ